MEHVEDSRYQILLHVEDEDGEQCDKDEVCEFVDERDNCLYFAEFDNSVKDWKEFKEGINKYISLFFNIESDFEYSEAFDDKENKD